MTNAFSLLQSSPLPELQLRTELHQQVLEKLGSVRQCAIKTGFSATALGLVFNGRQQLTIAQLNTITKVLGLPEGYYYDQYRIECEQNCVMQINRLPEFVLCCYQFNKNEVVERLLADLYEMTDKSRQLKGCMGIAERLYTHNFLQESLPLYEFILQREGRTTQRFAVATLRKYAIQRKGTDVDLTTRNMYRLLEVVDMIPMEANLQDDIVNACGGCLRADAYNFIMWYYNSLEQWDRLYDFARELEQFTRKNLDTYYGESLLYQFIALREMGKIEECFERLDQMSHVNDYYNRLAYGNRLWVQVEQQDDQDSVVKIFDWMQHDDEVKVFLPIAIECYLKHGNLDAIDAIISKYNHLFYVRFHGAELMHCRRKSRLYVGLARYYFSKNSFSEATSFLVESINQAKLSKNMERLQACVVVFAENSHKLSEQERHQVLLTLN